jgi:uncharacterized protein YyaL (SSP411 family)
VAAWNGFAIRAFAEAGAVLQDEEYLNVARGTSRFVLERMMDEGLLRRTWREGRVGVPGFLEDYAGVALGLFSLYAATGEHVWYQAAESLTLAIPRLFADSDGFFDTPVTGETLIKRPKVSTDNPSPSGNALAAEALLRLHGYTGSTEHRDLAEGALRSVALLVERFPSMVGHHLAVLHSLLSPRELAIVGPEWRSMARVYWQRFRPEVVLAGSADGSEPVPLLSGRAESDSTRAFVCRDHVCDLPVTDMAALSAQLDTEG